MGVGGKVARPVDGRGGKVGILQACDALVDPFGGDPPVERVVYDLALGDELLISGGSDSAASSTPPASSSRRAQWAGSTACT